MATEIVISDEFRDWYLNLTLEAQESVARVIQLLEDHGVSLKHPYSSAIVGSRIALRELRVQHMGEPYRILYAFDPLRQAILLVGGNKVGAGNRWYKAAIAKAETLYAQYLERVR